MYIYTQYNDYVVCIGKTFSPQKVREWGNCLYTILRDNRKVFFFRHKKGTDGFFYKVFDVCFLFFFIVLWLSVNLILYFLKRTYVLYRTMHLHVVRFGVIFLELPFHIVIFFKAISLYFFIRKHFGVVVFFFNIDNGNINIWI